MDLLIIIVLVIVAIVLFLIELFLVPGISIAGILSGGCVLYAIYHAFAFMGSTAGILTLTISVAAFVAALIWFMRSKTLDKISLKENITSKIDKSAEQRVKVGDEGITTTRLALIGYAEINGDIVEVKSTAEFIDAKTPVQVVRITDGTILVEKK